MCWFERSPSVAILIFSPAPALTTFVASVFRSGKHAPSRLTPNIFAHLHPIRASRSSRTYWAPSMMNLISRQPIFLPRDPTIGQRTKSMQCCVLTCHIG